MNVTNQEIAKILRSAAAALTIKKRNIFEIRAYQNASDAIEHSTSDVKDLWEEGKLKEIPGVGKNLQSHLDEYFETGGVKHFDDLKKGINPATFEFLEIPGVGPKTALDLAEFGAKSLADLKQKIESEEFLKSKKISKKLQQKIVQGLSELSGRTNRMLLPFAVAKAEEIIKYLKSSKDVIDADPLGSLRRRVATIGDLDFAASSKDPEVVIEHFSKMPGVKQIVSEGPNKVMVVLNSGLHVDLLVGDPDTYGALLQHFTGSKHHNIHLRTIAEKKGLSLSEYGVKRVKNLESRVEEEIIHCKTEEELYKLLGMHAPVPEMREDSGEIELAIAGNLPKVIDYGSVKGDFHLHSNFPLEPSHGPGVNKIEEIIKKAESLGYDYVGISDHSPSFTNHTKEQILSLIKKSIKSIRVLNGLEIDILGDGSLSVPDEALQTLDYCIAGIHSGHRGTKEQLTERILKALENPYVDILSHPTGRLINERGSYDADWEKIFEYCAKHKKLLEINSSPNRLDLRDDLVREALKYGVKFIIDTDSHQIDHMEDMPYGISVARRGWVEAKDIVNTWDWKKVSEWFNI